jgi:hypothetical protein
MNIDGNERMNILCKRESCVILCEKSSVSIRGFLCFCSGSNEEQFFFLGGEGRMVKAWLCISCFLVSNPSQATTFLVLNLNRFISSHQPNVRM